MFGILLMASPSFAAWTISSTLAYSRTHEVCVQVTFVGDGSALTAKDILDKVRDSLSATDYNRFINGIFTAIDVVPSTTSAPDNTFTLTITDALGVTKFSKGTIAADSNTTVDMSEDALYPFVCPSQFKVAFDDIGTSGDTITLQIHCWIE